MSEHLGGCESDDDDDDDDDWCYSTDTSDHSDLSPFPPDDEMLSVSSASRPLSLSGSVTSIFDDGDYAMFNAITNDRENPVDVINDVEFDRMSDGDSTGDDSSNDKARLPQPPSSASASSSWTSGCTKKRVTAPKIDVDVPSLPGH